MATSLKPIKCEQCGKNIPIKPYHIGRLKMYYSRRFCDRRCLRITHNGTKLHPELYGKWKSMRERCLTPSTTSYPNYGGRGIAVCKRWDSFTNFLADMGDSYKKGLSLERIDVNGDYEPSNCRWATRSEQARNTRRNRYITYKNKTQTLADWSDELSIKRTTITQRIDHYKWTIPQALGFERR